MQTQNSVETGVIGHKLQLQLPKKKSVWLILQYKN